MLQTWYSLCFASNISIAANCSRIINFDRKEMRNMPWYTNPVITCKVLNKIANRYERTALQDLKSVLDHVTKLIWVKQEHYYENTHQQR